MCYKYYISEFLPLRSSLLTVAGVVVALGGLGEPMVGFQLFHLPYKTILGRKLWSKPGNGNWNFLENKPVSWLSIFLHPIPYMKKTSPTITKWTSIFTWLGGSQAKNGGLVIPNPAFYIPRKSRIRILDTWRICIADVINFRSEVWLKIDWRYRGLQDKNSIFAKEIRTRFPYIFRYGKKHQLVIVDVGIVGLL